MMSINILQTVSVG